MHVGDRAEGRSGRLVDEYRRILRFDPKRESTSVFRPPKVATVDFESRLYRALEVERSGFQDGAITMLRRLKKEIDALTEPRLVIHVHFWLASFLASSGEVAEARALAEDGILLAWEQGAKDELDLLDALWREISP